MVHVENLISFVTDGLNLASHHVPINVTLRRIAHGADAVAAQWDFDLLNGQGGWKSDGCHILLSDENITTIQCYSLSNYAVLMVWHLELWVSFWNVILKLQFYSGFFCIKANEHACFPFRLKLGVRNKSSVLLACVDRNVDVRCGLSGNMSNLN